MPTPGCGPGLRFRRRASSKTLSVADLLSLAAAVAAVIAALSSYSVGRRVDTLTSRVDRLAGRVDIVERTLQTVLTILAAHGVAGADVPHEHEGAATTRS